MEQKEGWLGILHSSCNPHTGLAPSQSLRFPVVDDNGSYHLLGQAEFFLCCCSQFTGKKRGPEK